MSGFDTKKYELIKQKLDKQVKEKQPDDIIEFCSSFFKHQLRDKDEKHPLDFPEEPSEEETDTVSDDIPELDFPSNRGRRTSVSAESIQPNNIFKINIPKSHEQKMAIRKLLKDNFLFKNLEEEQYADIVNAIDVKNIPENTTVIQQGDSGEYFYAVDSGHLDCFIDGKKVTCYEPSGSFGELALMYNAPRAASIVSTTDCVLFALDRISFRCILMENTSKKRSMYNHFLREVPTLKSMENYERHKIADALESVQFEDKDIVIRQGDVGGNFYLIESGEAIIYKTLENGSQKQVMVGKKGDYFGELALINDEPRAASVIAHGRLKCATLGKKAFTRLLGPVMNILKRNTENYHAILKQSEL